MQLKRRIFILLFNDLKILLYESNKNSFFSILQNIVNYVRLKLFYHNIDLKYRKAKLRFLFKDGCYNLGYNELIEYLKNVAVKYMLIKMEILTDAKDYISFLKDLKNKIVIDIGAWKGDTVLLFHLFGARKIYAIEPIEENLQLTKRFLKRYNINCEIFNKAIWQQDGELSFKILETRVGSPDFSLENIGRKKLKIKCMSWGNLLRKFLKYKNMLIKVDCEGCEKFLLDVEDELLCRFSEWIIECHSLGIAKSIYKKFCKNGFKLVRATPLNYPDMSISILYFKRFRKP